MTVAQPIVLLTRRDHPLARRGGPASIAEVLGHPLALMPSTFGIGHAARMLEFAESVRIHPSLTANSLTALKRIVEAGSLVALIGEFAVQRELAVGKLAVVPAVPRHQGRPAGEAGAAAGGRRQRAAELDHAAHVGVRRGGRRA
ncbi:MAG: LysR substrate-binding domain-containing protein [Burkholderia sp.]